MLGEAHSRGFENCDVDSIWKVLAYSRVRVLEAATTVMPPDKWARMRQDERRGSKKSPKTPCTYGAVAALKVPDDDVRSQLKLIDVFAKCMKLEQKAAAAGLASEGCAVNDGVKMLKSFPYYRRPAKVREAILLTRGSALVTLATENLQFHPWSQHHEGLVLPIRTSTCWLRRHFL